MEREKWDEKAAEVKKLLLEGGFSEFRIFPKPSQRGFSIIDPVESRYLSFLSEKVKRSLDDCVVVCPLGFGNLEHEFPDQQEEARRYLNYLQEIGESVAYFEITPEEDTFACQVFVIIKC